MFPNGVQRENPVVLVNYPDHGMNKNDSTTAIDRGFPYIGINVQFSILLLTVTLNLPSGKAAKKSGNGSTGG